MMGCTPEREGRRPARPAAEFSAFAASRAKIEQGLSKLEEGNWCITAAVQGIFAGERDAAALTADLDPNSAALVGRILEHIAAPSALDAD